MDESRKAFEQWISNTTTSDLHRGIMLDRRESGGYSHLATENKWEAWQASRAAIDIELPDEYTYDEEVREHASQLISDCAEAIRAAGIKVKE